MHPSQLACLAGVVLGLLVPTAQAQTPPTPPLPKSKSAFEHYKPFTPKEPMADWRKANDTVEALDGHAGHLRGAPKPKSSPKPEAKK